MTTPRKDEEATSHIEPEKRLSPSDASLWTREKVYNEHVESERNENMDIDPTSKLNVAAKLRNPLVGMSEEEVLADADAFVDARELQDKRDAFRKGAFLSRVAQRENGFENISMLSKKEKG